MNRLNECICNECPLLGKPVVITGTSRGDLNGRAGVARSFDHVRGRYVVELQAKARNEGTQKMKVKPGNLIELAGKRQGGGGGRKEKKG